MSRYWKEKRIFPGWVQNFPMILLLFFCFLSGCSSTPSKQLYTHPKIDISLEKPADWNLEYIERSGRIVLKAKNETGEKSSTRVEISGSACVFRGFSNPREEVEADIDRLRGLYHLSSVTFIQNLSEARIGDYLVTKAVIGIPVNDWNGKGSGTSASDELQPIAVFAITRTRDTVMAYIYLGQDERLNAQAQEIVDSIRITCAAKP